MPEGHMDSKQKRNKRLNSKQNRKKKQQLIEFYGCYCWWCGKDFPEDELNIEHLTPLSRGGTNNFENLRLAFRQCNSSRGNSLYPPPLSCCPFRLGDQGIKKQPASLKMLLVWVFSVVIRVVDLKA